jgi:hypothetical protein
MVVKHPKSLENIYDSLENLLQFFSSVEGGNSDSKVLSKTENVLLKLEQELRFSTKYKPKRKDESYKNS